MSEKQMTHPTFISSDEFGFNVNEVSHWHVVDGVLQLYMKSNQSGNANFIFHHANTVKTITSYLRQMDVSNEDAQS